MFVFPAKPTPLQDLYLRIPNIPRHSFVVHIKRNVDVDATSSPERLSKSQVGRQHLESLFIVYQAKILHSLDRDRWTKLFCTTVSSLLSVHPLQSLTKVTRSHRNSNLGHICLVSLSWSRRNWICQQKCFRCRQWPLVLHSTSVSFFLFAC